MWNWNELISYETVRLPFILKLKCACTAKDLFYFRVCKYSEEPLADYEENEMNLNDMRSCTRERAVTTRVRHSADAVLVIIICSESRYMARKLMM